MLRTVFPSAAGAGTSPYCADLRWKMYLDPLMRKARFMGDHRTLKVLLVISLWPSLAWAQPASSLPRGHVFFQADFESPDALQPWSGSAGKLVREKNGHALLVERPSGSPSGSATVQITLPIEQMRGYVVDFSARVKAENVQGKAESVERSQVHGALDRRQWREQLAGRGISRKVRSTGGRWRFRVTVPTMPADQSRAGPGTGRPARHGLTTSGYRSIVRCAASKCR